MLLAIPVTMLGAEAFYFLIRKIPNQPLRFGFISIIIVLVFLTSAKEKIRVNTAVWKFDTHWIAASEIDNYLWLRNKLPVNTKIFSFTHNYFVIGVDMLSDFWTQKYQESFKIAHQYSIEHLHKVLTDNDYAYILIRYSEKDNLGGEIVYNDKVQQFKKSLLYSLSFTNPSNDSYIFKIN